VAFFPGGVRSFLVLPVRHGPRDLKNGPRVQRPADREAEEAGNFATDCEKREIKSPARLDEVELKIATRQSRRLLAARRLPTELSVKET
jgi:hypothetical protein